jgi:hypothetical protein
VKLWFVLLLHDLVAVVVEEGRSRDVEPLEKIW